MGLVLIASGIAGFGAGVIWINQGVWVSRVSKRTGGEMTGYFTGVFFTVNLLPQPKHLMFIPLI